MVYSRLTKQSYKIKLPEVLETSLNIIQAKTAIASASKNSASNTHTAILPNFISQLNYKIILLLILGYRSKRNFCAYTSIQNCHP